MTQKLFGIVLTLMLFIAAVPFASAGNVSLYAYWVGANTQSLTVTQGSIPQIMITADSLAPSFNLVVDLYKGSQKINTLLKVDNLTQDSYTKALSLNTASLLGDYTIQAKITSYNSSDVESLILHVNPTEETVPPPAPQNHSPVLNPIGDRYIPVGETLQFTLSATDADNDKLYFGAISFQPNMKLNSGSGKFIWTPSKTGTYAITFTVTDGQAEDSETIQIYVLDEEKPDVPPPEPKNTAPQMNNIPALHVNESDTINYVVSGTDAEQDQLTYYVHTLVANGVPIDNNPFPNLVPEGAHFDSQTGVFTFSPDYDFIKHPQTQKTLQLRFKAYDGKMFSDWKVVTILVNDVNRKPTFVTFSDQIVVYAGETVSFDLYATDADVEDVLSYAMENAPLGSKLDGTAFTWQTKFHDLGSHLITFSVSDGFAQTSQDVQIIVKQKPVEPTSQCSDGKDNDGDKLVDMADPGCTNPEDDDETNLPVPPVDPNSLPVIGSLHTQFGMEGKLLQFTVTIFDKNGDKILLTPYSADPILPDLAPINGQGVHIINNNDGTFTIQLQPLYSFVKHPQTSRSFTLILEADDGKAKTTKNVLINIKDVNQKPQFKPIDDQIVYVGDTVSFTVEAIDADNDTLNYAALPMPDGATYAKSGFSWKPTKDQVGLYTVTFTVNDGFVTISEDVLISVMLKGDTSPPPPPQTTQCSDGKDNDGDKLIDMADPGCANPQDNDETNNIVPPVVPPVQPPIIPPVEEPASADFFIKSVTLAPEELVNGNWQTQVFIKVENETLLKAEDVRGIVMIPELGIIQSTRQFDVAKNGSTLASVGLSLPPETIPGTYLVQILVKNDSLHSVAYRQLTILK
ncbi:putative Ig domain-containing protein [Candidatus Woesearchaeota archaeon]|nr:putative Ig domain-containing protein [Candidatus Woesearchaeota archaeon]